MAILAYSVFCPSLEFSERNLISFVLKDQVVAIQTVDVHVAIIDTEFLVDR